MKGMMMLTIRIRSAATNTATKRIAYNIDPKSSNLPLQPQSQQVVMRSFVVASTRNITTSATATANNSVMTRERSLIQNRSPLRSSNTIYYRPITKLFLSTTTTPSPSTVETKPPPSPPLLEPEESSLPPRDIMMYDVCIVGGGPAGLSAAIRIKQLCQQYSNQKQISVCVIDKGRYGVE
jgi:hypothetical protein